MRTEQENLSGTRKKISFGMPSEEVFTRISPLLRIAQYRGQDRILIYQCVMGDPTVHLCPTTPGRDSIFLAIHRRGRLQPRALGRNEAVWMTQPRDNGGLTAYDLAQTKDAVREGLADPACCKVRSADWLKRHVHRIDGRSSERFAEALAGALRTAPPLRLGQLKQQSTRVLKAAGPGPACSLGPGAMAGEGATMRDDVSRRTRRRSPTPSWP